MISLNLINVMVRFPKFPPAHWELGLQQMNFGGTQFSPQQEGIPHSNSHVFFTFQTIQHQTEEETMNGSIMECPNCSS